MALTHRSNVLARIYDALTCDSPQEGGPNVNNTADKHFSNGTTNTAADLIHDETYTVGAGATTQLDMRAALTQPDGSACVIAEVVAIMVRKTAGTGSFSVQRPAANGVPFMMAAGDGIAAMVTTGDTVLLLWNAGVATVAGTADLIDIVEIGGAASVTVHVTVLGRSA